MGAFLVIKVECDSCYGPYRPTCDAKLLLSFKTGSSKLRGDLELPDGWSERVDHYSTSPPSYCCPGCTGKYGR